MEKGSVFPNTWWEVTVYANIEIALRTQLLPAYWGCGLDGSLLMGAVSGWLPIAGFPADGRFLSCSFGAREKTLFFFNALFGSSVD